MINTCPICDSEDIVVGDHRMSCDHCGIEVEFE